METKNDEIQTITTTICYLYRINKQGNTEFLLGKHHKQKKWNGFGGKVGDKEEFENESILESVEREGLEEFGIRVSDPTRHATILFDFFNQEGGRQRVLSHVFFANSYESEVRGSDEMLTPTWFTESNFPWDEMWPHDKLWLKDLLNKDKYLNAELMFDPDDNLISSRMDWKELDV